MAWQCKRWEALPEQGGLNDQPAGLLDRMARAYDVWEAAYSIRHMIPGRGATWAAANPHLWELWCQVSGWDEIIGNG